MGLQGPQKSPENITTTRGKVVNNVAKSSTDLPVHLLSRPNPRSVVVPPFAGFAASVLESFVVALAAVAAAVAAPLAMVEGIAPVALPPFFLDLPDMTRRG